MGKTKIRPMQHPRTLLVPFVTKYSAKMSIERSSEDEEEDRLSSSDEDPKHPTPEIKENNHFSSSILGFEDETMILLDREENSESGLERKVIIKRRKKNCSIGKLKCKKKPNIVEKL